MIPKQIKDDLPDEFYYIDLFDTDRSAVNVAKEIAESCDPTNVKIKDTEIKISYGPEVDVCYEYKSYDTGGGFYILYQGNIVNGHWF
jgi:hypothetical protein